MGNFLRRRTPNKDQNEVSARSSEEEQLDIKDIQKIDQYKKGISHMSDDKMEDAIRDFDLALRLDPGYVDAWIKKGYAHFHLDEFTVAISCYEKALEIDINNAEAWNLKGLAFYKLKNYEKAIQACENAIDFDPNDGMAWYNLACYLVLSQNVGDGLEALKRSIEIDISFARKAVRDRDFEYARAEEGFRRIVEVVVLEAIRQGYNYPGKIVWITSMDKEEVEYALNGLAMKGLIVRKEQRYGYYPFGRKEEYYELAKAIAERVGTTKRTGFLHRTKTLSAPVQQLRDISEILGEAKMAIERGDLDATTNNFELLINPNKHGAAMIEQFLDDHRDLRLYQIRLKDRGLEYLNSHKAELLNLVENLDAKVRAGPVSSPQPKGQ
ncbi:MAG TPA: tetratricopeptide repeat protein [Nitrososphaeraceae archaeon]|nr:tetratricopeptide repeat protein [Nitrososphaeraceae archaeon]